MVQLTETAVGKVREILDGQEPKPAGLRIAVVGGGCSGFSYSMAFENTQHVGQDLQFQWFEGFHRSGEHALPGRGRSGLCGVDGRLWVQV